MSFAGALSTPRSIYWVAQGAIGAGLILAVDLPLSWLPWGIAVAAECYLIPSRLSDAGHRPWLPFVVVAAVAAALWLFGVWLKADQEVGSDGLGLLYGMVCLAGTAVTAAVIIIWPGLLPGKPRGSIS